MDEQAEWPAIGIDHNVTLAAEDLLGGIEASRSAAFRGFHRLAAGGESVDERLPITGGPDDAYTPLGLAVREGQLEIVELLLDGGVDPRRTIGLMRGTVLHVVAYFGRADMIRVLTTPRGGPTVELDATGPYNGFTALHDAVWHGHADAVRALVAAGARTDLRTDAALTARDLATLYGYDAMAAELTDAERA